MAGLVDITPGARDVALLLANRTVGRGGGELDKFDETTRPTDAQVAAICDVAARDVMLALEVEDDLVAGGAGFPDLLIDDASQMATLRAAVLVELSFYGDATNDGRRAALTAAYLQGIESLRSRLHW